MLAVVRANRHVEARRIMRNGTNALGTLGLLFLLSGCDTLTGPETLGAFSWAEIEGGGTVEAFADFAAFGRDVLILGEFNTPTACFRLTPHLTESATRLTLRIEARTTQTPNCADRTGAFRYEATLNGIDNGTYALVIVHDVQGNLTEFEHSLIIGS
jgi:hypothetical protein